MHLGNGSMYPSQSQLVEEASLLYIAAVKILGYGRGEDNAGIPGDHESMDTCYRSQDEERNNCVPIVCRQLNVKICGRRLVSIATSHLPRISGVLPKTNRWRKP
jgi:hypothetical protein